MGKSSGIGVLDKAVEVLRATSAAPTGLADLCATTGLPGPPRTGWPSASRCTDCSSRDANGRWCPGPMLAVLAAGAPDPLVAASADVLPRLRDRTGESVQVYRPDGLSRICIAVAEPTVGSAGHRAARIPTPDERRIGRQGAHGMGRPARPNGRCWPNPPSPNARWPRCAGGAGRSRWPSGKPGVASVSAPVRNPKGAVIAAVSVSGPVERIGRRPGARWAGDLVEAADALTARL